MKASASQRLLVGVAPTPASPGSIDLMIGCPPRGGAPWHACLETSRSNPRGRRSCSAQMNPPIAGAQASSQPRALGITRRIWSRCPQRAPRLGLEARRPGPCPRPCDGPRFASARAGASRVPTRKSGAACAKASAVPASTSSSPARMVSSGGGFARSMPPRRCRSTMSGSRATGRPSAGAPRRTVTVRRPRQSGWRSHSTTGDAGVLGAERGVAAATHGLFVALDLFRREVVAPHHFGEELHDALELFGDDAIDAGRQEWLHLGDVRVRTMMRGRVRDARHRRTRCAVAGSSSATTSTWRDRRPASCSAWLRLASAEQHGKPGPGRLGRASGAERGITNDARAVESRERGAAPPARSRPTTVLPRSLHYLMAASSYAAGRATRRAPPRPRRSRTASTP